MIPADSVHVPASTPAVMASESEREIGSSGSGDEVGRTESAGAGAGPPVCAGKPQATAASTNIMNALREAR